MINGIDWADLIVKQTETVFVIKRTGPDLMTPVAWFAECRAHDTRIKIDETQAFCVEDSLSFCPHCLTNEAPKVRKLAPETEALRAALVEQSMARMLEPLNFGEDDDDDDESTFGRIDWK